MSIYSPGNPLKDALLRGEAQFGSWINLLHSPATLSLMKASGLDFARLDMEHSGISIETVANLALFARAIGLPLAVRPPVANREWITRLLDIGVLSLHCPQVENIAHAREIVAASRYAPLGLRGQGYPGPASGFDSLKSAAKRRADANRDVFVTVMFETAAALRDLDAIAALEGIDALTIGPADLAQDLGLSGTPRESEALVEIQQEILDAALRHGKIFAALCTTPAEAAAWEARGARLLACSSDAAVLQSGFSALAKGFRDALPPDARTSE